MTSKESTYLWGFCVFAPTLLFIGSIVVGLLNALHDLGGALTTSHELECVALPCLLLTMSGMVTYDMLKKLDKRILDLETQLKEKEAKN